MKTFIYKILLFFFFLAVADFFIGGLLVEMQKRAKGGAFYERNYIADKAEEDILFFGSSRAMHHYVPSIVEDSMSLSSYNCGADGNGAVLMYGRYKLLTQRYTPKAIIYDANIDYDFSANDNIKYISHLRDYYDYPGIDSIFSVVDSKEKLKMNSKLYRCNSKIISIASNFILNRKNENNGYFPLYGTMEVIPDAPEKNLPPVTVDSLKVAFLEAFVEDCNKRGIKLMFTISPFYFEQDMSAYAPLEALCEKHDIPLLNCASDTIFLGKKEYFKDSTHLNHDGAVLFTSLIMPELKKLLGLS